jgi:AmmeMemoRadiSam system protein B/AmmeMemoRadiSam system protein A
MSAISSFAATREPAVAGQFYPADRGELTKTVLTHLNNVGESPEIDGQIIALIVPHAGFIYSGQIAAYSYKLLQDSPIRTVILCGPSHRYPLDGLSVYGPDTEWKTPLGIVKCDNKRCRDMVAHHKKIDVIPAAHSREHSLEVQLPYLQTILKDFTIVPTVMGRPNAQSIDILADALASLEFDDSTVMVASTDWQHYLPAIEGWKLDSLGLDCLENLDPDRLMEYLAEGKTQLCGGGPAVSVLKAAIALGANSVKILEYGDSGDITGDKSSVVSYVAAVIYKSGSTATTSQKPETEKSADKMSLTDSDMEILLDIARSSIETYLKTGASPKFEPSENLIRSGAAFVTLNKQNRLRGCIGHTVATQPLWETVSSCAVSAAVSDPRFPAVTLDEVDDLHIEISVLTPLQKIKSLDEIQVGRDGLMIFLGRNRGLLLPQVATDNGWNRTEFLQYTCRKAGLALDAYTRPEAEIYKFQAIIFEEQHK